MPVDPQRSLGYQQIVSATLAASTALTVPAEAQYAVIVPDTQAVRWRDDGTAPTAAIGMPVAAGQPFTFDGDLTTIRFIRQAAGAILNVAYYSEL